MPKIVVTGGAGFIGSHLVDHLADRHAGDLLILDNLHRGQRVNIAHHHSNSMVAFAPVDIRDYSALVDHFAQADVVFHLAAQSNVMGAAEDVDYSFSTNVVGTVNVLKAARAAGVGRVVFTSSREVYGEGDTLPVAEDHPLNSKNSYGASKAAGELYCRVFHNNFGVETVVLRLANVYGRRDFGRVIPLWLERAQQGQSLIVYGGKQIIDFISVDLVVEALVRAAHTPGIAGRPINIGSGQGTPILHLAERIQGLFGYSIPLDHRPARSIEVVRFVAAVERMRSDLGVEPPADPLDHLPQLVQPTPA